MSEDDFKARVMQYAKLQGWLVNHARPARRANGGWATAIEGDAGLPDLTLARDGVLLLAELKSDTGRPTDAQQKWLAAAGPHGRLWAPRDWNAIVSELSRSATKIAILPACCNPPPRG